MEGFMKPTTDFPFLLDNPRAWRTYLGGRMLDALHGDSNGEDGHFPEEWILSTVAARNAGREQFPEEGMEPPARHRRHPEIGAGKRYGGLSRQRRSAAHPRRASSSTAPSA